MSLRSMVGLLFVLVSAGCAQLAKRPASPASFHSVAQLEQASTSPCERYYLIVFSAQSVPAIPRLTHSWATAVRVVEQSPGLALQVEQHTISWMPASLDIHPWRWHVEQGVNLDMHSTINEMLGQGLRVSMWGPLELRPGWYRKFLMQKDFLESGQIGYKCIDFMGESAICGNGSDCVHAITDCDPMISRGGVIVRYGDRASQFIVDQLALHNRFCNDCHPETWLIRALKLDQYPICFRTYDGPR